MMDEEQSSHRPERSGGGDAVSRLNAIRILSVLVSIAALAATGGAGLKWW
jgi:hypothetical protein